MQPIDTYRQTDLCDFATHENHGHHGEETQVLSSNRITTLSSHDMAIVHRINVDYTPQSRRNIVFAIGKTMLKPMQDA